VSPTIVVNSGIDVTRSKGPNWARSWSSRSTGSSVLGASKKTN
jgi:hypothetical protein